MVTAQRNRLPASRLPAQAIAPALRRVAPPAPRERAVPKSRRRDYQAWMTLLVVASGLFLALGVLSLYGRICQTQEINRRSVLNSKLAVAKQRGEELTLQRARAESDHLVTDQAGRFDMIRRTESDAVTISSGPQPVEKASGYHGRPKF